jgi:hypothetical protein
MLPPPRQTLKQDTLWEPQNPSRVIKRRVVVPEGLTLTISPGTRVAFRRNAALIVHGQLVAEGTYESRIHLGGTHIRFVEWKGISFLNTHAENRMAYVDIAGNVSRESLMVIKDSTLSLDQMFFTNVQRQILEIIDSSVIVRNSVFPPVGEHEVIAGERISPGGQLLIEGNEFFPNFGYKDIIDFSDCARPGPIPVIRNNLFRGGGDDGLDLDRCDAEVSGNIFINFNLKGHDKFANAVSLGDVSQVTISNNVFAYNDHAVATQGSSKATVLNCAFVSNAVAVTFKEGDHAPGAATVFRSVFTDNTTSFKYGNEARELKITECVLPEAAEWPGSGNTDTAPHNSSIGPTLALARWAQAFPERINHKP